MTVEVPPMFTKARLGGAKLPKMPTKSPVSFILRTPVKMSDFNISTVGGVLIDVDIGVGVGVGVTMPHRTRILAA